MPGSMGDKQAMLKGPFQDLLAYKRNNFSQNGEDGIIERIFEVIGVGNATCCEFGAWDGIHLSNCRQLILQGWKGIMIEGDAAKYSQLARTYHSNDRVHCVNAFVDNSVNRLSAIVKGSKAADLDFLSVDIDGLDYEIFEDLDISPRVICIEVNAGHNPAKKDRISRDLAQGNIGQSLGVFSAIANAKGYGLVCYTGNAFYVRRDELKLCCLKEQSDLDAYVQFLEALSAVEKEWLYLVSKGLRPPYYKFNNPLLSGRQLRVSLVRGAALLLSAWASLPRCL